MVSSRAPEGADASWEGSRTCPGKVPACFSHVPTGVGNPRQAPTLWKVSHTCRDTFLPAFPTSRQVLALPTGADTSWEGSRTCPCKPFSRPDTSCRCPGRGERTTVPPYIFTRFFSTVPKCSFGTHIQPQFQLAVTFRSDIRLKRIFLIWGCFFCLRRIYGV